MNEKTITYKSAKSRSEYTVTESNGRAYLAVSGESSTNAKVLKQIADVRKGGGNFDTVAWIARQLSQTF